MGGLAPLSASWMGDLADHSFTVLNLVAEQGKHDLFARSSSQRGRG